jgi:hypothetical protein
VEAVRLFDHCEIFVEPERVLAENLERFADWIAADRNVTQSRSGASSAGESFIVNSAQMALAVLEGIENVSADDPAFDLELEAVARNLAESIGRGDYREDPAFQSLVVELNIDRRLRWQSLLRICRRIEIIAHKQLRGVAFTEKENYLLADFGLRLASILGYGGTSFQKPGDDVPRIVAAPGPDESLRMGIGRPRELLVRYPFRGRQILCRGAVLPFFPVKTGETMTDARWKEKLGSDERSPRPEWMAPIQSSDLPSAP